MHYKTWLSIFFKRKVYKYSTTGVLFCISRLFFGYIFTQFEPKPGQIQMMNELTWKSGLVWDFNSSGSIF